MANLLACVRQSMLHSRRNQPVPHDFLSALNANSLTLSALVPHLDAPVKASSSQPPLAAETAIDELVTRETKLIERMMVDPAPKKAYIPANLPALPSLHTYKAEPVYASREADPKKVRERATEEGRLGEEALRRLVNSRSRAVNNMESRLDKARKSSKQQSRDLWKATMAVALKGEAASGRSAEDNAMEGLSEHALHELDEYSTQVNADSIYWRKPATTKAVAAKAADG
jgi:transcription initiation factor TFIID subunit 8